MLEPTPTLTSDTFECRHGTFTIFNEDELVGMSLAVYGEYSEGEVVVFEKCLREGHVAIDVGANIGAFTVPMAKLVGDTGAVIAFEASVQNVSLLEKNIKQNDLINVIVIPAAASDTTGTVKVSKQDALHAYTRPDINVGELEVPCQTIDSLELGKCNFIKIDVDRHELQVLKGAEQTIAKFKPIIYVENEDQGNSEALIAWLVEHGYRLYWHRPSHFNLKNFRGVPPERNLFGVLISIMMLCVPDNDWKWEINGLDEVADIRQDDDMFNREIARYQRITAKFPDDLMSRLLTAHYLNLMQRSDEAMALINENLAADPAHKASLNIKALLDLQAGRWHDGWKGYELRYGHANKHMFGGAREHTAPRWDGKPTEEPLLIWSEQGFGDQIMFARFYEDVITLAPNAVFEVQPELFELFETSFPHLEIYRVRRTLPYYALQLPLPSVPVVLDADAAMIMESGDSYLKVNPMITANWRGHGNHPFAHGRDPLNGARIGLCCVGSLTSERPYTRDIPSELIAPLVKQHGPFFSLEHSGQFESFATTAGAIMALDLVITVDTSIAHLAGALGKPVWLLLSYDPDWRWGLTGETSIWYPSMRIFRQPKFRDWKSVIANVSAALEERYA
jgi:FkbM family methyltransferase